MKQRRRFWKTGYSIKILDCTIIIAAVFFFIIFYALWRIVTELQHSSLWQIYLIILQLGFAGLFLTFLIAMFVILHRAIGPIPRMEKILERVVSGEYSLRIAIRKKDIILPFVYKLNQVLDLLEKKAKG